MNWTYRRGRAHSCRCIIYVAYMRVTWANVLYVLETRSELVEHEAGKAVTWPSAARRTTPFLMWSQRTNMRPKVFLIILQANDPFWTGPARLERWTGSLWGFSRLEKMCRRKSWSPPLGDGAIKRYIVCQHQCCHGGGSRLSCSSPLKELSCEAQKHEPFFRFITRSHCCLTPLLPSEVHSSH